MHDEGLDLSDAELQTCIGLLKRLTPSALQSKSSQDETRLGRINELKTEGFRIFGKAIREEFFQDGDVVKYLASQKGIKKKFNKLTRLHEEVTRAHASLVEENHCAGINSIREAKTQEVNTLGLTTMTSEYAAITLSESFESALRLEGAESVPLLTAPAASESPQEAPAPVANKSNFNRKKEFKFDVTKVRGMYDEVVGAEEASALRHNGSLYLLPRGGATEGGWLSFIVDDTDGIKRACSQRTVEIILSALEKLDMSVEAGKVACYRCSYVVGNRQQRWAFLGGAVEGLSGETAISVQLSLEHLITGRKLLTDAEPETLSAASITVPPVGSFRRYCNICKQQYLHLHFFYHQLCVACGDLNYDKRLSTADMRGRLCLVTGGRVRIGYQIALKLLRAGATVLVTSRWVYDAALRFSYEADFAAWSDRLHIDQLELSDLAETERYCRYLETTFTSLDALVNNAAQTLTRPAEWTDKMNVLEYHASQELSPEAAKLLSSDWMRDKEIIPERIRKMCAAAPLSAERRDASELVQYEGSDGTVSFPRARRVFDPNNGGWLVYDESGQPLDLSGVNSWSKRLADVEVTEMAQTMAVNSMAPFILCSRLKTLLTPVPAEGSVIRYNFIVNVTALEGKFNVGKKSGGHPHTNMSKAALNMLTLTASRQYASEGILMNSVDTGWVTDMAPKGVGAQSRIHETFVGPPLDDLDGASRVLDPIFNHINSGGADNSCGNFLKDYMKSSW